MRFLIQLKVFNTLAGKEDDAQLRAAIGGRVPAIMQSGKVRDAGFMTDRRGVYFLADIDRAEELYDLLGPEVYGHCEVQASPVAPLENIAALFQQWGQQGR